MTKSARKDLFWGILKAKQGQDVPLSLFVETNAQVLPPKVGPDACRGTLNQMQHDPDPLATGLTVGKDHAHLDYPATEFEQRERHRPVTKSQIGRTVWKILFGVPEKQVSTDSFVLYGPSEKLKDKISDLQRKSLVTVLIDAGSTTAAAARQFNQLKDVPLPITFHKGDKEKERRHLLRLSFISNAIPLIAELSRGPHRNDIGLTVVGGEIRGDRASVCGLAAQVFLDECSSGGDIAIVGTTGYGGIDGGERCFFSDNLEEARLKASFLDRAFLRVLLFDSSKLAVCAPTRVFTHLAADCVDLIVTDDGVDQDDTGEDHRHNVRDFLQHARENGVAVALVKKSQPTPTATDSATASVSEGRSSGVPE